MRSAKHWGHFKKNSINSRVSQAFFAGLCVDMFPFCVVGERELISKWSSLYFSPSLTVKKNSFYNLSFPEISTSFAFAPSPWTRTARWETLMAATSSRHHHFYVCNDMKNCCSLRNYWKYFLFPRTKYFRFALSSSKQLRTLSVYFVCFDLKCYFIIKFRQTVQCGISRVE